MSEAVGEAVVVSRKEAQGGEGLRGRPTGGRKDDKGQRQQLPVQCYWFRLEGRLDSTRTCLEGKWKERRAQMEAGRPWSLATGQLRQVRASRYMPTGGAVGADACTPAVGCQPEPE